MKHLTSFRRLSVAALAAFALPAASSAQTTYTLIDLDPAASYTSAGSAINASGQVAGAATPTGATNAARWTGTTMQQIGITGGPPSYGLGINDSGQVAGYYSTFDFASRSFVDHVFRVTGATFTDLGTLGGSTSRGNAINASGQIAGWSYITNNAGIRAARWTGAKGEALDTLGGPYNYGYAINASGQVAGQCMTADQSAYHAVIWTGTALTELGLLSGKSSAARAINDSGQAAGSATTAGGATHAVRWTGTTPTDLGALGGAYASGLAMNNSGVVVGFFNLPNGDQHAFVTSGNTLIDLNTLLPSGSGWSNIEAYGINDSGWITGQGALNGRNHAVILRPNNKTVYGSIGLEGVGDFTQISPGAPLGTFHIGFRTPNTTTEIYGADVALTAAPNSQFAAFTVPNIPNGVYDVTIKGAKNLRVLLPSVIISDPATLPPITLPGGDANNDNSVDSTDFGLLVGAFNTSASVPGSGYDPIADFNFDGFIDSTDFSLLIGEFNSVGAP